LLNIIKRHGVAIDDRDTGLIAEPERHAETGHMGTKVTTRLVIRPAPFRLARDGEWHMAD
jgi:hypothetical protein